MPRETFYLDIGHGELRVCVRRDGPRDAWAATWNPNRRPWTREAVLEEIERQIELTSNRLIVLHNTRDAVLRSKQSVTDEEESMRPTPDDWDDLPEEDS